MSPAPPTAATLAALAAAIAAGVTRVHFQDRTVDYDNTKSLLEAYTFTYALVYPTGSQPPKRRQTRMITTTGW
jgi:hypothetical protein